MKACSVATFFPLVKTLVTYFRDMILSKTKNNLPAEHIGRIRNGKNLVQNHHYSG